MGVEDQVHVLVVTMAWQGHINPMLKLAKRLVSKGVHVTIATTEGTRYLATQKPNIPTSFTTAENTTVRTPQISLEFFSDGLDLEFDRLKYFDSYIESLETIGYINLSNLIQDFTNDGKKFSCIISNPFMPWVPKIATKYGIPCAVLWIQACTVYSIYYHYFKNPNSFPTLIGSHEFIELPGMPKLQVKDLPSFILPSCSHPIRKLVSSFIQNLDEIKWVLGNSFDELEEEVIKSMASLHPICPIGPLVSSSLLGQEESINGSVDMWIPEDSCIEWLDKKPPSSVVYISFGSVASFSQKQIDNIAMGLKNSNRPFLWVIKPPEKCLENTGGELSYDFLKETEGRGLVVAWCPQEKVLMHQAVACFITHCGWNSTLETMVAGVPVIAYPDWTDQPTVAKLVTSMFNVGVRLEVENGVASSEEIERCIMEVTDGPEAAKIQKRALELKEAAKKAVADGGSSDANIDQFIREFIEK
ncbi:UDP-glycosyltransferase 84B1-like [Populus alba x Populus x berolinensis]|nr:UDP-glycosyltransferase 84B1-like [Populus alba x Populus x berolinensis]